MELWTACPFQEGFYFIFIYFYFCKFFFFLKGKCMLQENDHAFVDLAYQDKDIVFRFIIEYSSLMDFGP